MTPHQLLATGQAATDRLQAVLQPFALLALRLPVAWVFWASARIKVEGWNIFAPSPSAFFLFEHEYGLPFPVLSAHLATLAEHILPVLLVLGLATRLGALGLLTMTMVIQLFVYPDAWVSHHMFWATILFAVLVLGPGRFSLDHLILRRLQG
ncbi:DoxX family protein [Oceanibaculum indicum]|uniref:Putative oxidoreductase n=1 Tax=Oceanibaculum indicum TaxID=526216 RepID=A0A420WFX4_9PROT|nr:DoxX family protein [Oceanibaculum indicum]RKQ69873.1 putative oxidoreductase [Oceanibaculum indicum]